MANINKILEEAMKIDGAIGVALADWESGLCLGTAGGGECGAERRERVVVDRRQVRQLAEMCAALAHDRAVRAQKAVTPALARDDRFKNEWFVGRDEDDARAASPRLCSDDRATFEGEGHGFRQAANIIRCLEAELSFYAQVLGFPHPDGVDPVEVENLPPTSGSDLRKPKV